MGISRLNKYIDEPVALSPLVGFRILFGAAMVLSTLRFIALGWIDDHYIRPLFHFSYFGFSWLPIGPDWFLYLVHGLLLLASLGVMFGLYYRFAAILQFLCFTYTELLDLTYYLNHYYYVSLVCLLLIFLPANRSFSLDVFWRKIQAYSRVPRWMPFSLMMMMAIVYTYAGLAKINHDWLIEALPLRIWLPASYNLPILGPLFAWKYSPWLFSWVGMFYDCTIAFFLWNRKTRPWAYVSVIVFHTLTGILFQIGVFPLVMMAGTLIFFSPQWHERWMNALSRSLQSILPKTTIDQSIPSKHPQPKTTMVHGPWSMVKLVFLLFFCFQVLFPLRYLAYPGNLFWTEEGYRFSWRVMLVEKAGTAQFYISNGKGGIKGMVDNALHLNAHQEKQMSYQPDMLLQYADYLHDYYKNTGINDPVVTAEVHVTLNARPSQLLFDPSINLAKLNDSWSTKNWLNPYPWKE